MAEAKADEQTQPRPLPRPALSSGASSLMPFLNATTVKLFTTVYNTTQSSRALGWSTNSPLVRYSIFAVSVLYLYLLSISFIYFMVFCAAFTM